MNKEIVNAIVTALRADDPAEKSKAIDRIVSLSNKLQDSHDECESAEDIIYKMLLRLGVPANLRGYKLLADAIRVSVDNPDIINRNHITYVLYPKVAEMNGTTASRTERSIRHAIELSWQRGDLDFLQDCIGNIADPRKGKPTNSEYIAGAANYIRRQLKM